MSKKFVLFSSCGILLAVPIFVLTSCGQLSQYVPAVKMNIGTEKYYVGYGSNNVIYNADTKEQLDSKATKTKDLVKFYLTGILPFLTIADRLINLSHFSEDKSNQNLIYDKNLVFDTSDTLTNNAPNLLFKEFMYASSNTLNQGRNDQIKLYLSEIGIDGLSNGYLPYNDSGTNSKIFVEKLSTPITLKEDQKIYIYDQTNGYKLAENQNGVYFTNKGYLIGDAPTMNLQLTYRYYYPEDQNKFKDYITSIDPIKNYVNKYNAWNKEIEPSKTEFSLKVNVQITLRPKFEFSSYVIKSKDQKPTDDEIKKLVDLTEITNNGTAHYETTLDFNKDGASDKFSNWLYEAKFLPVSTLSISKETTPLLFALNENKDKNGMNDFSNSNLLNTAMGKITSTPSINTVEDYSKFINNIKEFKSFLTTVKA